MKRHLRLEVSAISKIDLDDHIFVWLTEPALPRHSSGRFRGRYVSCLSQTLAQAWVIVFEAGDYYVLR
jgi:hypothetical protein